MPEILQDDLETDYQKSLAVIAADKKASVKHLQQRLKLSYGRAAQIMAKLERDGILAPPQKGQAREILFDKIDALLLSSASPSEAPRVLADDGKVSNSTPPQVDSPEALTGADASLVGGWRNGDAALEKREGTPSAIAGNETGRSQCDTAVEKGSQSIAGSSPALSTNPIKLCVIAYLPKPSEKFHTLAFLENLKRNPPAHDLITFSDCPDFGEYGKPTVRLDLEGKKSIEEYFPDLKEKVHGFANIAFYLAFCIAWKNGFSHFLYAEMDCRFRNRGPDGSVKWDEFLVAEFLDAQDERPVELVVGGTMMVDNPYRSDAETAQRTKELLAKWNPNLTSRAPKERNKPIACRAQRGVKDNTSMVGCNGAGAVYSVAGLRALFPEIKNFSGATGTIATFAKNGLPFDWEIAKRLWSRYKSAAFDYVAHLPSEFSSFGDSVSTEDERMDMLRTAKCVLVHPVKSRIIE